MEVNEVKKKQQELERCVEHLIRDFYEETGCLVDVSGRLELLKIVGMPDAFIPVIRVDVAL